MRSSFQNRCQVFARCGFAFLLFQCCGCAHVAVVKTKSAHLPKTFVAEGPLESAKGYLAAAEHEQPLAALGHDLLAKGFGRSASKIFATSNNTSPGMASSCEHLRRDRKSTRLNSSHT